MSQEMQSLTLQLLDQTLQIRCPENQAKDIQASAQLLNAKMLEINLQGKTNGNERLVIMAAINAIYDLRKQQEQKDLYIESLGSRIRELQAQLNKFTTETKF